MKIKTALKQSIAGAWIAAVLALGALALAIKIPNAATFALLAFFVLFLIGDVVNIFLIKRRLSKDPTYLEEKIK
jgi:predicted PurR-regulated permease PerM